MFKVSNVKTRYFEFEAPDNGRVLHIEPPKLKTMNRLAELQKGSHTIKDIAVAVAKLISKNREGRKVTAENVMDWMDSDQVAAFIKAYLKWVRDEKQNDPN